MVLFVPAENKGKVTHGKTPRKVQQKKPTPLDLGPPLHVNRALLDFYTVVTLIGVM